VGKPVEIKYGDQDNNTEQVAGALLKLPDEAERLRVIGLIAQGEWTVAKTEQYIDSLLAPRTPQRRELDRKCCKS